ncbi:hypothetical protein [Haloferula sargassicola]|uniref:AsmA-like C-terminal domain-containing protein n=1 Tax=Haloferula sargassicola TaxID=490096 RepID=A0ABP9URD2_9BACT
MSSSEKDNYSIDEMLERLKSRSKPQAENEPELVTRPDGSQVYRVRKRKRRSRQPHKEKQAQHRRRMMVLISVATICVFLCGLGVLAWVLYLNGDAYQQKIEARIADTTGAGVELKSFRSTPLGVGAEAVLLNWPETRALRQVTARQVTGDLNLTSHLTGVWDGNRLRAGSVDIVVGAPSGEPVHEALGGPVPFRSTIQAGKFSARVGDEKATALSLTNGFATFSISDPDQAQASLVVEGGQLRIWNWGRFDLSVGSLKVSGDGIQIGTVVFSPLEMPKAEFRLQSTSEAPLPIGPGERATMSLAVSRMPSEVLFGADMGSIFEAILETASDSQPCTVTADLTDVDSVHVEGDVASLSNSLVLLHKLPFLGTLSRMFENPIFNDIRLAVKQPVHFKRDLQNGVELSDIDFAGRDILRLRGTISVAADGSLSGRLEVGIQTKWSELSEKNRAFATVFSREGEDFRWGTVHLSGTAQAPADDLMQQVEAALAGSSPAETGARGLEDEFQDLTR